MEVQLFFFIPWLFTLLLSFQCFSGAVLVEVIVDDELGRRTLDKVCIGLIYLILNLKPAGKEYLTHKSRQLYIGLVVVIAIVFVVTLTRD